MVLDYKIKDVDARLELLIDRCRNYRRMGAICLMVSVIVMMLAAIGIFVYMDYFPHLADVAAENIPKLIGILTFLVIIEILAVGLSLFLFFMFIFMDNRVNYYATLIYIKKNVEKVEFPKEDEKK